MNDVVDQEIQATKVELQQLKIRIFNLRYHIKGKRFMTQSRLMCYLTKTQYDYMNWYCEVLEKRLKIMEDQRKKDEQIPLPS